MQIALIVLVVLCCVLLVLFVLAQNSKGGASAQFRGSGSGQMMGVKKTTDLLEKLTWGFLIGLIALCVVINVMFVTPQTPGMESTPNANIDAAQGKSGVNNQNAVPGATEESATPTENGTDPLEDLQ